MSPTLEIGDHIYIERLSKLWRAPRCGELVIFQKPCEPEVDYLKRIVAVAHDTVQIRCDVLYINGEPVPQTLVDATCEYLDQHDGETDRIIQSCSRYRETVGGVDYDVFFDRGQPVRDAKRRSIGALTEGDVAPIARTEFPQLGFGDDAAPRCSDGDAYDPEQGVGRIVRTRTDVDPCTPTRCSCSATIAPTRTTYGSGASCRSTTSRAA